MNKRQLEVEKAKLREEKKLLKELKKIYEDAAKEVEQKIRISNGKIDLLLSVYDELDDKQKSLLQSQIYQKKFQENLKKQLDELIGNLNADSYDSITRYLTDSYYTGYIGTMYDIQGQGIPLITPINEKQVTRAMTLNTKLSVPLYTRMGIDVGVLKKQIAKHISRGIATSSSYAHIARNIDGASNIGFNKAMRIARTEGHRIQVLSANDAQHAAKAKGCEVVKQWDATLDGRTRPMHRLLDGKLAEIDEPFVVDDIEVMYPGGFGIASQDVNCRCALLQRARWALDADELKTLKERAEYYGLDKTEDFEDYKRKYLKISEIAEKGTSLNVRRIGSNKVDLDYIKSQSFRKKFNKLTNNTKLNDTLRNYATAMLLHRDGTDGEDLYIVDLEGNLLLRKISNKKELSVSVSEKEAELIRKKEGVIGMHNHPTNVLPTGSDIAAAGYRRYEFGIVVTHEGRVYRYSAGNKPFLPSLLDARIDKYCSVEYNLSTEEAYKKALNEFKKEYGITWEEIE
jgi:hypothetical protein